MAITYDLITKTTLSADTSTFTLSSIPNTYTDLRIVGTVYISGSGNAYVRCNSNTGSVYANSGWEYYDTTPTAYSSFSYTTSWVLSVSGQQSTTRPGGFIIDIFNYASTSTSNVFYNAISSYFSGIQSTGYVQFAYKGLGYNSTSAINSITFHTNGTNYLTGSKVSIYGIKAA